MPLIGAILLILAGRTVIRSSARLYLVALAVITGTLVSDFVTGLPVASKYEMLSQAALFILLAIIGIVAGCFPSVRRGAEVIIVALLAMVLAEPIGSNLHTSARFIAIVVFLSAFIWPTMIVALSAAALLAKSFYMTEFSSAITTLVTVALVWFLDGGLERAKAMFGSVDPVNPIPPVGPGPGHPPPPPGWPGSPFPDPEPPKPQPPKPTPWPRPKSIYDFLKHQLVSQ